MRLVILPGNGIGPEIAAATGKVLRLVNEKLSLNLTLETHENGLERLEREGSTFPASVKEGWFLFRFRPLHQKPNLLMGRLAIHEPMRGLDSSCQKAGFQPALRPLAPADFLPAFALQR